MTILGTALTTKATKVMLLGAGELGKEIAIELQRLGVEIIAVDRYANAPAMQVAHRSYVLDMQNEQALKELAITENIDVIVPEIEAIATNVLFDLEKLGMQVVPNAKAIHFAMNRESIRQLASEELKLKTSPYRFVDNETDFHQAVLAIGFPCVVKPVMSSSGKGQSVIKNCDEISLAWHKAQEEARGHSTRVVVEGFVDFDEEITLLTVKHQQGYTFLAPIGHRQEQGDYQESWQPQNLSTTSLKKAQQMALKITEALGGWGVFGVEFFIKGDDVIFNEISPRPHDTGMVTLISQPLSEFALHVRAFLGLPIPPQIPVLTPSASKAIVAKGQSCDVQFGGLEAVLAEDKTDIRLFGKGEVNGKRRVGVLLAQGENTTQALEKVKRQAEKLQIIL